jgi:hypothetical protein
VPLRYSDMATAYPDLFRTADAARMCLTREAKNPEQTPIGKKSVGGNPEQTPISYISIGICSGFSRMRYRRLGSRGPAVSLLYDPARVDPGSWLRERIGKVELLAPEIEDVKAAEPDQHSAPAARGFVEHRIRDALSRPRAPVRAELIRCDVGVPAMAELRQFFPMGLQRLQIDAAPEFMFVSSTGRARRLDPLMRARSGVAQAPGLKSILAEAPSAGAGAIICPPCYRHFIPLSTR